MQSKAKHLICVYEAGLCGDGLYRYLSKKGDDLLGRGTLTDAQKAW